MSRICMDSVQGDWRMQAALDDAAIMQYRRKQLQFCACKFELIVSSSSKQLTRLVIRLQEFCFLVEGHLSFNIYIAFYRFVIVISIFFANFGEIRHVIQSDRTEPVSK